MACRTNHLRRHLFACIVVSLLVAPLMRDARADEPAAPLNREALINAALGRPVSFEYKETPLGDVIKDLEKKLGVTVALETRALDEVGIGSDTPITIEVTNISAASALRHLLRRVDPTLTFSIRDGALAITTCEDAEGILETRYYDIADMAETANAEMIFRASQRFNPFPPGGEFDAIVELITATVEPNSWDRVGGPGSIAIRDGVMIVSHTREIQEQIAFLLTTLRKAAAAYKALSADLSPNDLDQMAAEKAFNKLLDGKGLNRTFADTPLADVAKAISEATKRTVLIDQKALDAVGIGADSPVTVELKGLTLREEIRWILKQIDPTLTFQIMDEALVITTREAAEYRLQTQLYPVWDLVGQSPARDYDSLIRLITSLVKPDSWDEVGGPGSIWAIPQFGCLIVSQVRGVHEKLQDMLAQLRAIDTHRNTASKPATVDDPYVVVVYELKPTLKAPAGHTAENDLFRDPNKPPAGPPTIADADKLKIDKEVVPLIQQLIVPASWTSDEVVIRPLGKDLVVRQRVSVHRRIVELLRSLELLEVGATSGGIF